MKPIVCIALVLSACATTPGADAPAVKPLTATDFYPLTVGMKWTYGVEGLSEKHDIAMLRQSGVFTEDSEGNRLQVDSYGVRDEKRYLLRNPIEPGTKWSNVISVSMIEHYVILGTNQPCQAPAGKWENCVVVESRARISAKETLVNEMTFAPGVGLVRVAITLDGGDRQVPQSVRHLLSFAQPQPPSTTSRP